MPKNTTQETPTTSWAEQVGTIVHVAPATLALVRNVRDAQPDSGLVASVREVGVLEPITAVVHIADGGAESLVVRFGHRRTLAAVEAKRETVPVYLAGTAGVVDGDELAEDGIRRVIEQRDENTHRQGLTTADNLGVVGQLVAFGLSANQISKRARIKRDEVDAALTVNRSALAAGAAARWDDMTLDQLAVLAEFEDDTEAITALRAASQTGKFEHVAQRLRDDRAREAARAAALAPVVEAGVRVVAEPGWNDNTKRIAELRLDPHGEPGTRGTPEAHGECPGHVAWAEEASFYVDADGNDLDESEGDPEDDGSPEAEAYFEKWDNASRETRWIVVYGCENWSRNGHVQSWQRVSDGDSANLPDANVSPAEADAAAEAKRAQRRLVIENNKAWDAAEVVRRQWVKENIVGRKTLPKESGAFVVSTLAHQASAVGDAKGDALAADWLGHEPAESSPFGGPGKTHATEQAVSAGVSEGRALVLALVQILAGIEASTDRMTWRRNNSAGRADYNGHGRYLRFLASCGYALSEVEEYALSDQTA